MGAHIMLEQKNLYQNILHHGRENSFDDIYCDENDNVLIQQNTIDNDAEVDDVSDNEDEDNESDIEDDDERKEGFTADRDGKTYIYPKEYKNIVQCFRMARIGLMIFVQNMLI